jgi:hypothetical protein
MIVFYSKPNMLSLPYKNPATGVQEFFRFIPGKNHIPEKTWLEVVKASKKRMSYYETVLSVFQPKDSIEIKGETEDGEEILDIEIGKDEKEIDYDSLNARDMVALVENTMEFKELEHLERVEKNRAKPRKTVMDKLQEKIAQVNEVDKLIEETKD